MLSLLLLNGARRTAVADEVCSEFAERRTAERHVIAQDLDLFAILDNGSSAHYVQMCRFNGIVQSRCPTKLGLADNAFPHLSVGQAHSIP